MILFKVVSINLVDFYVFRQDKELVNQTKKKKTNKELAKEDETSEKRPRRNRKRDKAADKRTIFVGNCPLSADKKVFEK